MKFQLRLEGGDAEVLGHLKVAVEVAAEVVAEALGKVWFAFSSNY